MIVIGIRMLFVKANLRMRPEYAINGRHNVKKIRKQTMFLVYWYK